MKAGHPFTDAAGNAWSVFDFRIANRRKRRVALGSEKAEARAFVRDGQVMVYRFGIIAYRETSERTLEQQLAAAKPLGALRETSLNERPA